jgi:cation transport ATPase
MDGINSLLTQLSHWTQPYSSEIAITILATILVVYGDSFNKHIKRMISPYHFVIRTLVFVMVCAFGYGLFIVFATPFVKQLILWVPYLYRGSVVIMIFLILGYLAENRRYI